MNSPTAPERLAEYAARWQVVVHRIKATASSLIGFGKRHDLAVVLKVARAPDDEWYAGAVGAAFGGQGMVRVYEHAPGAALLEELQPGRALSERVLHGNDLEATCILADAVGALHSNDHTADGCRTVEAWGRGFDRYAAGGDRQISPTLVEEARDCYARLCRTQRAVTLLHGDLQHYNILSDRERGWIAIDPKGVLGELEFELGPALRNPHEVPELYSSSAAIERRITCLEERLRIDAGRTLEWAYAQAVLSAIWTIEDKGTVLPTDPALALASAIRPLLNEDLG